MSSGAVTIFSSPAALVRQGVPDFLYAEVDKVEAANNQVFTDAQESITGADLKRRRVDEGYVVQGEVVDVIAENKRWDKKLGAFVPTAEKRRPDTRPFRVLDPKGEPVPTQTDVDGDEFVTLKTDFMIGTGTEDAGEAESGSNGTDARDVYFKGAKYHEFWESQPWFAWYHVNDEVGSLRLQLAQNEITQEQFDQAMQRPPAIFAINPDWRDESVVPTEYAQFTLGQLQDVVHVLKPPIKLDKAKRPAGIPIEPAAEFWDCTRKRLAVHVAKIMDPIEKETKLRELVRDVLRVSAAVLAYFATEERSRRVAMYDPKSGKPPKKTLQPAVPKTRMDRPLYPGLWDLYLVPIVSISFWACPRPDKAYQAGLPDAVRADPKSWCKVIRYFKFLDDFMTPMEPVEKSKLSPFDKLHRALHMGEHLKNLPEPGEKDDAPVTLRLAPSLQDQLVFALYKKYRAILEAELKQVELEPLDEELLKSIPQDKHALNEPLLRFLFTLDRRAKLTEMVFSMMPATKALMDTLCFREVVQDKEVKDSPKIKYLHLDWAAHGVRVTKGPVLDDYTVPDHVIVNLNVDHILAPVTMWDNTMHQFFGVHTQDLAAFPWIYPIFAQMDAALDSKTLPPLAKCDQMLSMLKDDKKKAFWRRAKDVYKNMENKIDAFTGTARAQEELAARDGLFDAIIAKHVDHPMFPVDMARAIGLVLLHKTDFIELRSRIFNFVFSHAQEYKSLHIKDVALRAELDKTLFDMNLSAREFAREELDKFQRDMATNGKPSRPIQKPQDPVVLPVPASVAIQAFVTGRLARVGCLPPKELAEAMAPAAVAPAGTAGAAKAVKEPMVAARTKLNQLMVANPSRKCFLLNSLLETAKPAPKRWTPEYRPYEEPVEKELVKLLTDLCDDTLGRGWRAFAVNPFKPDARSNVVNHLLCMDASDMGLLMDDEIAKLRADMEYNGSAKTEIMRILREKYHVGEPRVLESLPQDDVWNPEAVIYLAPPMPLAKEQPKEGPRVHLTYQEVQELREKNVLDYEDLMKRDATSAANRAREAAGRGSSITQVIMGNFARFIKVKDGDAAQNKPPSITKPPAGATDPDAMDEDSAAQTRTQTGDAMEVDDDTAALQQAAQDAEFQKALLGKKRLAMMGRSSEGEPDRAKDGVKKKRVGAEFGESEERPKKKAKLPEEEQQEEEEEQEEAETADVEMSEAQPAGQEEEDGEGEADQEAEEDEEEERAD